MELNTSDSAMSTTTAPANNVNIAPATSTDTNNTSNNNMSCSNGSTSHTNGSCGGGTGGGGGGDTSASFTPVSPMSALKSNYEIDVVRLIGQHLVSIGLKQTVESLIKEAGLTGLDHPKITKFQQFIIAGEWDKANAMVDEIASFSTGDKKSNITEMRLMIAQHKYLEAIEDNQHIKALKCLRAEITPLTDDHKRAETLANLLVCKPNEEVRIRASNLLGHENGIAFNRLQSRQNLIEKFQRFIPPSIMLPSKRMSTLFTQALQHQYERCTLHIHDNLHPTSNNYHIHQQQQESNYQNQPPQLIDNHEYVDLKSDHLCGADKFPLQAVQEYDSHKAEVWFCKFSNDGTKLATGGLGGKVKIWDVDPVGQKLNERCTLDCHSYSITCLSWSPNDVYLLACGSEDRPDLWVWNVNKEETHTTINHTDNESTTTCSWHISGEKFAAASIRGNFIIYDIDGNRRGNREGVRVQYLSFLHKDPNYILAADTLHRIKSYAVRDMSLETDEEDVLEEQHPIMSFIIDHEDRHIAVNLMEQGVHLWDFRLKTLLRMFPGVSQRSYTIYSSFSSPDSKFLSSGSEDGNVYIYHIHKDQPVAILHGHKRCVNCVTWNPKYPELLVSASDDRTIRLWAPLRGQ